MKFDSVRNASEMRELFEGLACLAIGGGLSVLLGVSWIAGALAVIWLWRGRNGKGRKALFKDRLAVLMALCGLALLLGDNWSSYKQGVSDGCDAAAKFTDVAGPNPLSSRAGKGG